MYSPKHRTGRCLLMIARYKRSARTPPPTLLFPSQQCQRASRLTRDRKETSAEQTLFPTEVGHNSPVSEEVLGAVHISGGVDGRYIGRTLLACQRACESFLTGRSIAGREAHRTGFSAPASLRTQCGMKQSRSRHFFSGTSFPGELARRPSLSIDLCGCRLLC